MGADSILVVIRGNSGSGKSTVARAVRARFGRGCALIEQDYLRRIVLREHDTAGIDPVAPAFITSAARNALDLGYHVVLEGIMHTERYGTVLRELLAEHPGHAYYFDIPLAETIRRHGTREMPGVTADHLRGWYAPDDRLGVPGEHVIGAAAGLDESVELILRTSGLAGAAAATPCPRRCPHCADTRD